MSNEIKYWKSLNELENGSHPKREREEGTFDPSASTDLLELSTLSRKKFLALLTASAAFAAAGCNLYRDQGNIVPYTKKPEEITPGIANHYASTCDGCRQSCGILIKTREGRPINVEGNPDHPINRGKICSKGQAKILDLYDPSRLRAPKKGNSVGILTWDQIDNDVVNALTTAVQSGKQIAIIARENYSPTSQQVIKDFITKYPTAKLYNYSLYNEGAKHRAWEQCYGTASLPAIRWEKAKIIVALEADFLHTDGMVIEQVRKYTDNRDIMKTTDFNRLYSIEGAMSLTGSNADYRLRIRPDLQLEFVLSIIKEIEQRVKLFHSQGKLESVVSLTDFTKRNNLPWNIVDQLVKDLVENRGNSIVYAGAVHSENLNIAVNYLNELLGNTALYSFDSQPINSYSAQTTTGQFEELISSISSGKVGVVLHFDSNPVYHLPKSFGYEDALKRIPISISLIKSEDETSRISTYTIPIHDSFESWGDYNVRRGIYSLQQPVIAPMYDTRQKEAVLVAWMNGKGSFKETIYYEYLQSYWKNTIYPQVRSSINFEQFWVASLHDGVVDFKEPESEVKTFNTDSLNQIGSIESKSEFTLMVTESAYMGDGEFANNGWLQELPDPLSKIVWDNYASIAPGTAKKLGVGNNTVIELTNSNGKVSLPVFLQPGMAENFVSVALGYGRTVAGPIGSGVGVDLTPLLPKESLSGTRILTGVTLTKTDSVYELSSTQEHHALDEEFVKDFHLKRKIIREGTLSEYIASPDFLQHEKPELFNIAPSVEYQGVKWAMAIDLNKCIGCNNCVTGCNVENNIPVVGKEQVAKGREMHWMRLDRYYSGTAEEPTLSHQPMLCQHCDNAPCENVCPVVATTHSPDGLNQMVYNRCVGTRYCSNNCPYKVRRFNFFNWRDHFAEEYYNQQPVGLVNNPDVTVRSRGVMEKCTFCVQRIMEARQHAAEQGVEVKGSDVRTACQESCPATAIVFGDMNDPQSDISKYRAHNLGYHVLEELNVRPNVTYMAKLRNIEKDHQS